jgi:YfiH family protein
VPRSTATTARTRRAADPAGPRTLPAVEIDVLTAQLGPAVRAGFTTRHGGRSTGPFAGLNLGSHVGDDAGDVEHNRRMLAAWAGSPVRFAHQVHGRDVLVVDDPAHSSDTDTGTVEADAVVAARPGIAVGVLVADCVPVLLADVRAGVVAAVHAGRKGFLAGVLDATLAAMTDRGARPDTVRAAIGPAAGGCCYEVPEELRAEAAARHPAVWAQTTWGTPSLDLRAGCAAALGAAGVADVQVVGGCTIEDPASYSYRRASDRGEPTGRIAGVVRIVPPTPQSRS